MPQHQYNLTLEWTGNKGSGTSSYRSYDRSHALSAEGKPLILASSDPAFRGDPARYNPEELLVASISSCHMLWYLHLCAEAGIVVLEYSDRARGIMDESTTGSGSFKEVTLKPLVLVSDPAMIEPAKELHHKANAMCFIANSLNFPVNHQPEITCGADGGSGQSSGPR
ncbi:MAG TPA: OsmC family protein [Sphingobacteriaceae bacterium]